MRKTSDCVNTLHAYVPAGYPAQELPWAYISVGIVFVFLDSIGFPGTYVNVTGEALRYAVEIISFAVQAAVLIRFAVRGSLTGLAKKISDYLPVLLFLAVVTSVSVIGTSDLKAQFVSCARLAVTCMFALWMAEHIHVKNTLWLYLFAQAIYVALAVCYQLLFPELRSVSAAYAHTFTGITGVKNGTASVLCLGIAIQLILYLLEFHDGNKLPPVFTGFLILQEILLIMTESTSATAFSLVLVAATAVFTGNRRHNPGLMCTALSIGFVAVIGYVLPAFSGILALLGKDTLLTGRIPIWQQLVTVIGKSHTLTGYGYGHFWLDNSAVAAFHSAFSKYSFFGRMRSGAHNDVIELLVNTGITGVAAFYAMLVTVFRKKRMSAVGWHQYCFCFIFLLVFTMHGLTERSWTTHGSMTMLLFYATGLACKGAKYIKTGTKPKTEQVWKHRIYALPQLLRRTKGNGKP